MLLQSYYSYLKKCIAFVFDLNTFVEAIVANHSMSPGRETEIACIFFNCTLSVAYLSKMYDDQQ